MVLNVDIIYIKPKPDKLKSKEYKAIVLHDDLIIGIYILMRLILKTANEVNITTQSSYPRFRN